MEATGVMWAEQPRWSRRQDLRDVDGPKLNVQCSNRLVGVLLKQLMSQATGSDLISEGSRRLSSKSTGPWVCFLASCWDSIQTLSLLACLLRPLALCAGDGSVSLCVDPNNRLVV